MNAPFADRLLAAVRRTHCCGTVNIDPVFERLPDRIRNNEGELAGVESFSRGVVDAVSDIVPVVKFNIAYFERYGAAGIHAYERCIAHAHARGLIVIGDIKRGDVGHTAEQYAAAHQAASPADDSLVADAITINGYFGWDGVKPFAEQAAANGCGVFVLVRTSNPSASGIQDLALADGRKVHDVVGSLVNDWSATLKSGATHYGPIGAVIATRDATDAKRLRSTMPNTLFLVPGYGAQGGTAGDFAPYLDNEGFGALIAAGRSVIFAHDDAKYRERFGDDWQACVRAACRDFAADLRRIMPD